MTVMAPIKLPCLVGGDCTFETVQLEYDQAKAQQDGHMQYAHTRAAGHAREGTKKPEKFPRPEVRMDSSAEDWAEFEVTWEQYKEEYSLAGPALIRQLYACCADELKQGLSRLTGGGQFGLTETNLLKMIKQLAVRYQNPAVHVQEFLSLSQQQDEPVRHYLTRLKGTAARCNFTETCATCNTEVSYADSVIRFKLISGLSDQEIKEDILSVEDKTLDETVKAIEAKESGKVARKAVGISVGPSKAATVAEATHRQTLRCGYCGRSGHTSDISDRERSCPAWSKTCSKCSKRGHFAAVCKFRKKKAKEAEMVEGDADEQGVRLNSVTLGEVAGLMYCAARVAREMNSIRKVKVPHMLFEQLEWVIRNPPPQPYLSLKVRVDTRAYRDQNFTPPSAFKHRTADMSALADTGCQAVCMGTEQLARLGLTSKDLLEVDLRLKGANGGSIRILGGLFITISGEDRRNGKWSTRQLCYVAEGVTKLMLSREACVQLGIISDNFPAIGDSAVTAQTDAVTAAEQFDLIPCSPEEDGSCSCPRRQPVPESPPEFDPKLSPQELRKRIIQHYSASAFNRCTRQTLPLMEGEPLPIPVKTDIRPTAVHTPVPVPLHWEEKVHKDLMRDVALGVIEPVPVNTPVTWCSRMVVVPKHNGEPRRTVDMQALNRASVRQTHHTKSPFMLASAVPAGKIKSVLDVWNSFHSVPIVEEDRDKTTFITPWGRFRYRVSPQGYLASMDGYTHRFSLITEKIINKKTIVDDTLLWSENLEENMYDVCNMLTTCHNAGLIFNSDKFQFGQETVEFAGLDVTMDGVRPCGKFLEGIKSFPRPDTLSEARSFFGMINQVSYSFAMSSVMEPFRHLLKPDTWAAGFSWTEELEQGFKLAKEKIIEAVSDGVKYFEMGRQTCLATDWSRQGIGFFLMQKWCECVKIHPSCCPGGWKLVLAGGRFTKPSESRYSPVEGELLAVADALYKARHFVLGCNNLIVAVDHKPLLGILNDKSLADIENPRLLMLKEKTLWFNFNVLHIAGRTNSGPDYMSRIPGPESSKREARVNLILGLAGSITEDDNETVTVEDTHIIDGVVASLSSLPVQPITFEDIKREVARDQEMKDLVRAITNTEGQDKFPDTVSRYNNYREELSVLDGVPMLGRRVIIPEPLRQRVLDSLHSAHQCAVKMLDRAKHSVFWPGIMSDIENTRRNCSHCDRNAPTQPALPPLPLASPDYPFQMIVADYFDIKGKSWLVIADRFSGWLSLHYYPREANSSDLIKSLKEYFCIFGVPENFSSDDGPQFRSTAFKDFLLTWGTEHRVSSAYHPHSNLRAETAVKSGRRLLMDNTRSDGSPDMDKVIRALMQHRNTPDTEYKLSPSQLVFGRPIRDFLPIRPGQFSPTDVWVNCRETRELAHRERFIRGAERWSRNTRDLKPLNVGNKVLIQNQHGAGKIAKKWERTGQIIESLGYNKYRVKIDGSGRVSDRNRQFLRRITPVTPTMPGPIPSPPCHGTTTESPEPPTAPIQVPVGLPQPQPEMKDNETNNKTNPDPVLPGSEPEQEPVMQTPEPEETHSQGPLRRSARGNAGKPPSKYSPSIFDLS